MNGRYQWFLLGSYLYRWDEEADEMRVRLCVSCAWADTRTTLRELRDMGAIGPTTREGIWEAFVAANQYPK